MSTLDATRARDEFADTLNRAAYGKERVILTRRGRELAAVVPIEDVRLLEELEGRPDLQERRAALAEAALLQQMLGSSATFLKARGCGIFLWDREEDWLRGLVPFAGLEREQVEPLRFPVEDAALAPAIREREPVLLNRITGCTPDLGLFRSVGFHNLVAAPLATRRELKGVCVAFDRRAARGFDEEDATVLTIMARQMAAVLEVTRAREAAGR